MKFSITNVLFLTIIVLAFTLRFWGVQNFPAGFNADEAAIGYNAYSILQTGRDEYGTFLPLSFKSFGDYKPGLYFYFVLPFVAVLGLSEFAVRFPSALLGLGQVILIYFLAKEIFKSKQIGLISAFLLAITPWSLHFSRGGWETNAATFFISLGFYLYIKSDNSLRLIFFSILSFLISMYLYQSPRLLVPFFVLALILIYQKKSFNLIKTRLKSLLIYGFVLFILSVPLILQFTDNTGSARFSGLSFFSDKGPANRVNQLRGQHKNPGSLFAKVEHNKLTAYFSSFLGHYLDHFSADFLFINGDPIVRNKIPETGQFYLFQSVFLLIGILALLKLRNKESFILVLWLLIAPLASSMTYQTPNAVRSLNMVIPLTLICSYGFMIAWNTVKKYKIKVLFALILTAVISFEMIHYFESYYIHTPKRYPLASEYGFSQMVSKLNQLEDQFDQVVITDRDDQPYILVLFYKENLPDKSGKKYDPEKYQPQAILSERDKFNFGTVRNFDKYEFHKITNEEINKGKDVLYIVSPEELPKDRSILDQVNFPN